MMDRLQQASARLSNARRELYASHSADDPHALDAVLLEVEVGLAALGDLPLPAPRARECVSTLRSALAHPPADPSQLYSAVDDLASILYWTDVYRTY
jgi:hypothetical protein